MLLSSTPDEYAKLPNDARTTAIAEAGEDWRVLDATLD